MRDAFQIETKILQALADPSRRSILESLAQGEAAVKELTTRFDISQPAVSQHLATLKEAGLVTCQRKGRMMVYRIEPNGMQPLIDWMAYYQTFWPKHIKKLEQLLDEMEG